MKPLILLFWLLASSFALAQTSNVDARARATANQAVSSAAAKAPIADPAFTGTPTAPTAQTGISSTQIANMQAVKNELVRWFRDSLTTYGPGFDQAQFVRIDSAGASFIRINPGIVGSGGVVDQSLSLLSTRAVSNAAVTPALNNLTNGLASANNAIATNAASLSALSGLLIATPVLSATATDPTTVVLTWTTTFAPLPVASSSIYSTTATTVGELQRVLSSAPAGSTIRLLPGVYPFNGTSVTASFAARPNVTIDGGGTATFALGSVDRLLLNGASTNLTISGIAFNCTATTGNTVATGQGLLDINEQGVHTDLTITNCSFTAPQCLRNGISINTYSAIADGGSGTQGGIARLKLRNSQFQSLGRMGVEVLNHAWSDNQLYVLVNGVETANCTFTDLGRVAETGGALNGMAASFSGRATDLRFVNNGITDAKTYGLEIVGTSNVTVAGNTINYVSNSFVGISLADGYGNGADATRNIAISGNSIRSKSRPINMRGSSNIDLSGNTFVCDVIDNSNGSSVYLQKCAGVSFTGGSIITGSFNPLRIDDCSEVVVSVPRITGTNTNNYALISVYGGTGYTGAGSSNIKLGTSGTVFKKSTGVTSTSVTESIGAVTALTTF